jgi:hypothetical protein
MSREAIDFIVNEMTLENFMKALEWREFGTNELFLGSLDTSDAVGYEILEINSYYRIVKKSGIIKL